jgi:hypothetical protein
MAYICQQVAVCWFHMHDRDNLVLKSGHRLVVVPFSLIWLCKTCIEIRNLMFAKEQLNRAIVMAYYWDY